MGRGHGHDFAPNQPRALLTGSARTAIVWIWSRSTAFSVSTTRLNSDPSIVSSFEGATFA